jgi:riboflavin kinase
VLSRFEANGLNSKTVNRDSQENFFILYKLAEMGALDRTVKTSTKLLGEKLSLSQQTVSRRLIEMEKKGLIHRTATQDGSLIRITNLGDAQLRSIYSGLNAILEEKRPITITIEGTVFSGFGEGAYYITRTPYRKQFIEKLGFDPYPGTLNLKITSEYNAKMRSELEAYPGIEIEGFKNKNRSYGPVKCFRSTVNNKEKSAVVLALRTHYNSSVLEVIAPSCLRERLKLRDGDTVEVKVHIDEQQTKQ